MELFVENFKLLINYFENIMKKSSFLINAIFKFLKLC